jgi:hypothetical protein
MLPKSKSARVQLALELQARGAIPNMQDFIRFLDLPGTDFLVRSMDLDTKKQHRELAKLLAGQDCEVAAFDNHAVHLSTLNDFRKSEEYENLPDTLKARVDAHAAVHEELLLSQAGLPTPANPQGEYDPTASAAAAAVKGGGSMGYMIDPSTGTTPDPAMIAAGQAPSPVTDQGIYNQARIGQQAGQPGQVPGIPADNQAASMGA